MADQILLRLARKFAEMAELAREGNAMIAELTDEIARADERNQKRARCVRFTQVSACFYYHALSLPDGGPISAIARSRKPRKRWRQSSRR